GDRPRTRGARLLMVAGEGALASRRPRRPVAVRVRTARPDRAGFRRAAGVRAGQRPVAHRVRDPDAPAAHFAISRLTAVHCATRPEAPSRTANQGLVAHTPCTSGPAVRQNNAP